jgi:hypothetical protein
MQLVKTDLLLNEKCRSKQYCLFPFQFSVLLICVGTIDSKSIEILLSGGNAYKRTILINLELQNGSHV